ncbi:hypothetical protein ABPG75_002461 [Micractinium tetrahymenae]
MDFERAETFDDLLAANVRFLRGELCGTPYCFGLAQETGPLLPLLEQLHGPVHRVFTFESQPGLRQTRWVEPWVNTVTGGTGGNAYVETEQRAYLDCFVEAARLPALLARLRRHASSLCYFVDVPGQPEVYTTFGIPEGEVWTSTRGTACFNLTRSRSAPTKAGLRAAPWDLYTNAPLQPGFADEEVELMGEANAALAATLERCALVGVMAKRYGPPAEGQPSLLDLLLEASAGGELAGSELAEAWEEAPLVEAEVME